MNVIKAISERRSVRNYLQKEVSEEILWQILAAARNAPSASNRQEWRFVVVKDNCTKEKLFKAAKNQNFIKEAPVIIACCAETDNHLMICGQACYPIDLAIAIDHMTLVAVELGLGTCWVGAFFENQVKQILGIPESIRVVQLLSLGYPKPGEFKPKSRLPLKDIVFFENWPKG